MNLLKFLKDVVTVLKKKNLRFALAGGLVASLYRKEKRSTEDLDFLLFTPSETVAKAERWIRNFGLSPHRLTKAHLEGGPLFAIKRKTGPVCIVAGRSEGKVGLDFILPAMPWFEKALQRAAANEIDFGFALIPCLTVEDLIISKIYAFHCNPTQRFKDLDDLQSIFQVGHDLDMTYIQAQLKAYELNPAAIANLRQVLPKELRPKLRRRCANL